MAFKDSINKFISYFDTDDVSELEEQSIEIEPSPKQEVRPRSTQQTRPTSPRPNPRTDEVARRQGETAIPQRERVNQQNAGYESVIQPQTRKPQQTNSQSVTATTSANQNSTIALRYPKRYEDAPAIVDLLIQNESVLIDFEFMMEAQARRCIDFIDGASKVLYGNLQKVGASMYLLTPAQVSVDIEEIRNHHAGVDSNYDFDMKRR